MKTLMVTFTIPWLTWSCRPRQLMTSSCTYMHIREKVQTWATSWTRLKRTLQFFVDTLGPEDTEVLHIDQDMIKDIVTKIGDAATWPFLAQAPADVKRTRTSAELEAKCNQLNTFLEHHEPCLVPRTFGKHRVLLHLFSGRRRKGDVQFFMDALTAQEDNFILHVISIDIIIDPVFGDVTKEETCQYWLCAIRRVG